MSEAENMAIKISKRIVDYKIQKDDEPTAASAAPQVPAKETMHEDIAVSYTHLRAHET